MTITDIAKKAGVAKSTVSRVLNNTGYVSFETKKRVMNIIDEHQYVPSAVAQGLSRQESNMIGVILPEPDSLFFGRILRGIGDVLDKNNLTMILIHTDNNPKKEQVALRIMQQHQVKGLLLTTAVEFASREERRIMRTLLDDFKAPIVLLDRVFPNSSLDGVYFEDFNSAYRIGNSLIAGGNRTIGAIISDMKLHLGRERHAGFIHALQEHGLKLDKRFLVLNDFPLTSMDVYNIMLKYIDSGILPDAFFLSNSSISEGFFKAVYERGLVIGEQLCCAGLDRNFSLDILPNATYTYVDRSPELMGTIAANLLLNRISQSVLPRKEEILPDELIIKGSETRKLSKVAEKNIHNKKRQIKHG
jgi:LacI family transcriptional regulator